MTKKILTVVREVAIDPQCCDKPSVISPQNGQAVVVEIDSPVIGKQQEKRFCRHCGKTEQTVSVEYEKVRDLEMTGPVILLSQQTSCIYPELLNEYEILPGTLLSRQPNEKAVSGVFKNASEVPPDQRPAIIAMISESGIDHPRQPQFTHRPVDQFGHPVPGWNLGLPQPQPAWGNSSVAAVTNKLVLLRWKHATNSEAGEALIQLTKALSN